MELIGRKVLSLTGRESSKGINARLVIRARQLIDHEMGWQNRRLLFQQNKFLIQKLNAALHRSDEVVHLSD